MMPTTFRFRISSLYHLAQQNRPLVQLRYDLFKAKKRCRLEFGNEAGEVTQCFLKEKERWKNGPFFRQGGLEFLLVSGNDGGRKVKMSAEVHEALMAQLEAGRFRTAGQIEQWDVLHNQLEWSYGTRTKIDGSS